MVKFHLQEAQQEAQVRYPNGVPVLEDDARTLMRLGKAAAAAGDWPAAELAFAMASMAAWLRDDVDEDGVAGRLAHQILLFHKGSPDFKAAKLAKAWKRLDKLLA